MKKLVLLIVAIILILVLIIAIKDFYEYRVAKEKNKEFTDKFWSTTAEYASDLPSSLNTDFSYEVYDSVIICDKISGLNVVSRYDIIVVNLKDNFIYAYITISNNPLHRETQYANQLILHIMYSWEFNQEYVLNNWKRNRKSTISAY